jgi:transcriptional regulator with XRE-family HTH domain
MYIRNVMNEQEPEASEAFKLYRQYLRLSQGDLADEMGVTATSISRWETGTVPLLPYSQAMMHIKALVEKKLQVELRKCIRQIKPDLTIGEFEGLFGLPSAAFRRGRDKKLYIGHLQIMEHHDHTIHYSIADERWLAIDQGGIGRELTPAFLKSLRHNTRPSRKAKKA